ncbi:SICA antigen [Plasmodium coatneyi]|uniref:SICA antigen n=1 Tax=Plasmodium coatneyi TaxID=208452 RepID=A0A1B1E771_9APIC|nr:SICA antigen [Plasmodium coatneyi]ANQ10882.1 SICA antigen [Plasmodium coatneyi]
MAPQKDDDKDKVFGPLKEKWLKEKESTWGKGKPAETQLMAKMKELFNEILAVMNIDEYKDTAQAGCAGIRIGKREIMAEEMDVCTFIVKNLWNMKKIRKGQCEEKNMEEEMKEHLYCAMMKAWSYLYLQDHCDRTDAVWNAFSEMKNFSKVIYPDGKCKECVYGLLEPMNVLGQPMLATILDLIRSKRDVMTLIDKVPKKKCPPPKPNNVLPQQSQLPSATGPTGSTGNGDNAARSAEPATNGATSTDSGRGEGDFLLILGPDNPTVTIARAPSGRSSKNEDAVVLTFSGGGPPATVQPATVSSSPSSGGGTTCKNSELQKRLKEVTDKWFTNRGRDPTQQIHWDRFWNTDVKEKLLNELSQAMTKNGQTDSNLCSAMKGANKAACNYFVSGLEHIYKIEKGAHGNDQQMKEDNLIFHRTASCLLLNAYADKLKELAEKKDPPCNIDNGIKHAFDDNKNIWKSACTGGGCVQCKREPNLKCKINKEEVKDRVNKMLKEKESEIQQTLTNICSKPPVPPSKTTSQATSTKDCKDGDTNCLNQKVNQMFQSRWEIFFMGNGTCIPLHGATNDQVYGLFQEFNRELNEKDQEDGYTAVCDEVVQGHGVTQKELHNCFCKILMRNLRKVTSNDSTYNYKNTTWKVHTMKPNGPCDLLNLWLVLYGSKYDISKENIEYAFKAITNLNKEFPENKYEDCVYTGNFSVNEAKEGVGYREIYKWFLNYDSENKMWAISNENACKRKDGKINGHPKIIKGPVEDASENLKTKAEIVIKEIEDGRLVIQAVDEELNSTKSPPPTSTSTGSNCSNIKIEGLEHGEEGIK